MDHDSAANLVILALNGPRGAEVASAIVHKWLTGGTDGVPQQTIEEIVSRWPYRAKLTAIDGQVERLSLLEVVREQAETINVREQAQAFANLKGREFLILEQVKQYLQATLPEQSLAALGLSPAPKPRS